MVVQCESCTFGIDLSFNTSKVDKQRAGRNKTITLTEEERGELKKEIATMHSFDAARWENTIVCADLLEVIDRVPDGVADLIIIDPPYNLSKDFNGLAFSAISSDKYAEYLRTWFHKVCDKLKPTGSLYMCGDWKCTSALQAVLEERLTILNRITWQRDKGRGAKANWKNCMEDIWFAVNDAHDYYFDVESVKVRRRVLAPYRVDGKPKDWEATEAGNYRLTHPSNFWDDISIPFWSMLENTDHPTQKPEKLYAKLILASSREGDVVFDPFMGSGTAAVVAKKLGRRYLGIEINEEYCLWAAKRLKMADENAEIQGYADGVFWERNSQRNHTL